MRVPGSFSVVVTHLYTHVAVLYSPEERMTSKQKQDFRPSNAFAVFTKEERKKSDRLRQILPSRFPDIKHNCSVEE
jgi:hypothetical protein